MPKKCFPKSRPASVDDLQLAENRITAKIIKAMKPSDVVSKVTEEAAGRLQRALRRLDAQVPDK